MILSEQSLCYNVIAQTIIILNDEVDLMISTTRSKNVPAKILTFPANILLFRKLKTKRTLAQLWWLMKEITHLNSPINYLTVVT